MCLQSLKPVLKCTLVVLCIAHTAHTPLWGWNLHQSFSQKNMGGAHKKMSAEQRKKAAEAHRNRVLRDENKEIQRAKQRALKKFHQEMAQKKRQLAAQQRARMLHKKPA